ncbi:MAG: tRNA (adenosine(37)-N6)-threonylcarbamoyltransferase complex dimerization subunit type 1 TsaB [Atribacterota bacterium]
MILALDSSTSWMSMGLFEKDKTFFEVSHHTTMGHSRLIFRYLERLGEEFNFLEVIQAVVVGLGPGFFTGVKIATMIGKSLAYALQKPVYGFSTLEVMANQVSEAEVQACGYQVLVPVIMHKRNEVFWTELNPDFRVNPGDLNIQTGSLESFVNALGKPKDSLIITPWAELKTYFENQGLNCYYSPFAFPQARSLAHLYFLRQSQCSSHWTTLFQLVPIYGSKIFHG